MALIVISSAGTMGDFVPFVSLGKRLQARGHRVLMAINPAMLPLADQARLEAVPCGRTFGSEEAGRRAYVFDHWTKLSDEAIRAEWRTDNPCRGIARNYEEPRARYLKPEELERLTEALAACRDPQAADAVRLLLLTGARRSEVLGARWDQFDLDGGIWIKPSSYTKQRRQHRVPLSSPAVELLRAIRERQHGEGDAHNARRRVGQPKREFSPFVFPDKTGSAPITDLRHDWARLCRAAGLDGLRMHDLRHSYASILASAGLSLPVIGALLGHTQPSTTARYSHLLDDPRRAATEKVGEVVGAAASKVVRLKDESS